MFSFDPSPSSLKTVSFIKEQSHATMAVIRRLKIGRGVGEEGVVFTPSF